MQTIRITLKDKTRITIENAKEIRTNLCGNVIIRAQDKSTIVKIADVAKYEIIEK